MTLRGRSYGKLPETPAVRVYCLHGDPVGEYPGEIAALLSEDEIVRLQLLLLGTEEQDDELLADKLRSYQLDAFVRWHG